MATQQPGHPARPTRRRRLATAAAVLLSVALATGCAAPGPAQQVSEPVGSDRYVIPVAVRTAGVPAHAASAPGPAAAAAPSGRPGGCFSGQIGGESWARRAAEASVQVVISDDKGWRANSTGFVVRGSGGDGDARPRIVTAWHSVDKATLGGQGLIAIRDASGRPIGRAEVVARGAAGSIVENNRSVPRGDMAVLAVRDFVTGGEAAYAAIEGVDIAPEQPGGLMTGLFERPAGIEPGASGSAALDEGGRVVGVIVAREQAEEHEDERLWAAKVTVVGGQPTPWLALGVEASPTRDVRLLARSVGYALPLADGAILGALGDAGRGVTARSSWSDRTSLALTVNAYPMGACITYRGTMSPQGAALAEAR